MDLKAVAVLFPFLLNFILLFNRKKKWAKSSLRWLLVLIMFCSGLILLFSKNIMNIEAPKIVIWGIMTPLIFSIIDYMFKMLSFSIHSRDLHLWVRGSSDIDDSKLSGGKHVRASDRIFSMIMLFLVLFLPFLGIVILK